jgi:hypothetical protein
MEIDALLPIGMKFVKMNEATSSHAVAGRSYWDTPPNSSEGLAPRFKVRTFTRDCNAFFSAKQTKLF